MALLALVLAVACGPTKDTIVGIRSEVLPITLAAPKLLQPAPQPAPPPILVMPGVTPYVAPGVGATPLPEPSPKVACPDAGPLTFPAVASTVIVASTAPVGNWEYRGTLRQGGQAQPVVEHWIVSQAHDLGGGAYDFVVTEGVEGRQNALTYHYSADASGVYLTEIEGYFGSDFKPLTKIALLQTPADPTAGSWTSAGADPVSGIAMTYTGQVKGRKHVNACGEVVDSWEVAATATVVAPGRKVDQTLTFDFATQYGGLIVRQVVQGSSSGLVSGDSEEDATIDEVP